MNRYARLFASALLVLSPIACAAPAKADTRLATGTNLMSCHVAILPAAEADRDTVRPDETVPCLGIAVETFPDGGIYHFFLNQGVRLALATTESAAINTQGTIDRRIDTLASYHDGQELLIQGAGGCSESPDRGVYCEYNSTADNLQIRLWGAWSGQARID